MKRGNFKQSKIYRLFVRLNSINFDTFKKQVDMQKDDLRKNQSQGGLRFPFEKEYIDAFNGMRDKWRKD